MQTLITLQEVKMFWGGAITWQMHSDKPHFIPTAPPYVTRTLPFFTHYYLCHFLTYPNVYTETNLSELALDAFWVVHSSWTPQLRAKKPYREHKQGQDGERNKHFKQDSYYLTSRSQRPVMIRAISAEPCSVIINCYVWSWNSPKRVFVSRQKAAFSPQVAGSSGARGVNQQPHVSKGASPAHPPEVVWMRSSLQNNTATVWNS